MVVNPHRLRNAKGHFIKGRKFRKNPSKKRHAKKHHARRHNPHALAGMLAGKATRGRRRYHKNPFGDTLAAMLAPVAGGAVTLGMDALIGYATQSRPDIQLKLQTGAARPLLEAATGLLLGAVAAAMKQPKIGAYLAAGGLSVAGYNALRLLVVKMVPDAPLPLGEAEEYPALSFYNPNEIIQGNGMGASAMEQADALSEFMPGGPMGAFLQEGLGDDADMQEYGFEG